MSQPKKKSKNRLNLSQVFRLLEMVDTIFDEQHEMRDWQGPEPLDVDLDSATLDQVVLVMDATHEIDGMIDPDYEVTLQELLDAEVQGDTLVVQTTKYRGDSSYRGGPVAGRDPVTLKLKFKRVQKTTIALAKLS